MTDAVVKGKHTSGEVDGGPSPHRRGTAEQRRPSRQGGRKRAEVAMCGWAQMT